MTLAPLQSGRQARGRAFGKVILTGEHAVVHGHAALAAPLKSAWVDATVDTIDGDLLVETTQSSIETHGVAAVARAALNAFGREGKGLRVYIESNIPPRAGLGSSAATALATVRAVAAACSERLSEKQLLELADVGEQIAHGRASGVDTAASQADGVIHFLVGTPPVPVPLASPFWLIVGDSGIPRNTRQAVRAVTEQPESRRLEAFSQIDRATAQMEASLQSGQLSRAGQALDLAHCALEYLGLNTPPLERMRRAARNAGALGAKLTGAGLGGCIIALAASENEALRIQESLLETGAANTFVERLAP
ncbi:MAG: mevalonate kinase [Candidatus Sericytochromatia bacterium]|nr:mevalonate kinase [Candidatus Sericytochromatia bacterium]